jgi:hypothetical protein
MPGIKRSDTTHKYNKITQQKKFHLLTLFHQRHYSLKKVTHPSIQAAAEAGINYLTAKTIVFFHKKEHRSYQFKFENAKAHFLAEETASYMDYECPCRADEKKSSIKPTVEVICSIGNVMISSTQ